jgi:Phospholipase B
MRKALLILSLLSIVLATSSPGSQSDARLKGAFRLPPQNGWTYVHLEGSPSEIGFQHGYLLAREIEDFQKVVALELGHDTKKDWSFFRSAAEQVLWPHVEQEYRDEMQGLASGLAARGVKLDLWDVVAINAYPEWGYYARVYDKQHSVLSLPGARAAEHCSAFVATGSYTRDGRVIMAHNNWTSYMSGERWTVIFDIAPATGHHVLMDGLPGLIHSGDDFGINSAGILITETTISGFSGYDANGIPEFVRARKAMQYSVSIDDFARIMEDGNNGGYANDWLVADRKTNEIASLELGLKNVTLERKKDGYFVGSNFPISEKLAAEETDFAIKDMGASANARHRRWDELMEENKGRIDVEAAKRFLADHFDTYTGKAEPSERTLCGHVDLSPRGLPTWEPPYGIAGAVQNKVADAALAEQMSFTAAAGHACGISFKAAPHLAQHPEFGWQKGLLGDMNAYPWRVFKAQSR